MTRGPETTIDLPIAAERAGGVPALAEIPVGASWPRNHHPALATKADTSAAPAVIPFRHRTKSPKDTVAERH